MVLLLEAEDLVSRISNSEFILLRPIVHVGHDGWVLLRRKIHEEWHLLVREVAMNEDEMTVHFLGEPLKPRLRGREGRDLPYLPYQRLEVLEAGQMHHEPAFARGDRASIALGDLLMA